MVWNKWDESVVNQSTDSDDKVMVEQSSQFEIKKLNEYIYNGSLISTQNFNLLV